MLIHLATSLPRDESIDKPLDKQSERDEVDQIVSLGLAVIRKDGIHRFRRLAKVIHEDLAEDGSKSVRCAI